MRNGLFIHVEGYFVSNEKKNKQLQFIMTPQIGLDLTMCCHSSAFLGNNIIYMLLHKCKNTMYIYYKMSSNKKSIIDSRILVKARGFE